MYFPELKELQNFNLFRDWIQHSVIRIHYIYHCTANTEVMVPRIKELN
jgi:hypothetical protein